MFLLQDECLPIALACFQNEILELQPSKLEEKIRFEKAIKHLTKTITIKNTITNKVGFITE